MKKNNIISTWNKAHIGTDVGQLVTKNMEIVEKVRLALDEKGWSKCQFADIIGINQTEVAKWLSGMHNITLNNIIKMESALGINLHHSDQSK